MTIKTAYIDVVDTTNLIELSNFFIENNIQILSTGKTSKYLKRNKIEHVNVDKLDGWITLNQAVTDSQRPYHIDVVVVNIPDTSAIINKPNISIDEVFSKLDTNKIDLLTVCSLTPKVITLSRPNTYDEFIKDYTTNNQNSPKISSNGIWHITTIQFIIITVPIFEKIMDHKCVKTRKLLYLENIAKLSTIQVFETDSFINLAMYVEMYVEEQSDEWFDKLQEQLEVCKSEFPYFNDHRHRMIHLLIQLGYIVMDDDGTIDNPKQKEKIVENSHENKDNVVSIFSKQPSQE